jgi:hypothetical protein
MLDSRSRLFSGLGQFVEFVDVLLPFRLADRFLLRLFQGLIMLACLFGNVAIG